jgi:hypothetical protein
MIYPIGKGITRRATGRRRSKETRSSGLRARWRSGWAIASPPVGHQTGDGPYTSNRRSVVIVSHAHQVLKRSNISNPLIITASEYGRALVLPGPGTSDMKAICARRPEVVGSDSRVEVVHAARPFNACGNQWGQQPGTWWRRMSGSRGGQGKRLAVCGACWCLSLHRSEPPSFRQETCCFKCTLVKSARYMPARATMRTGVQGQSTRPKGVIQHEVLSSIFPHELISLTRIFARVDYRDQIVPMLWSVGTRLQCARSGAVRIAKSSSHLRP